MNSKWIVVSVLIGLLAFTESSNAGLFSSDPVNVPEDRFQDKKGFIPSGVPLDTEYIIHGGDVGSYGASDDREYRDRLWSNPADAWQSARFLKFYLKLDSGKWVYMESNQAESLIGKDSSIERFAFIFAPKSQRQYGKEHPNMGNARSVILSPYRVTYDMNRILEDNLVALYTNRGCIVPDHDYANNPQAGFRQKYILMQCGCRKPLEDRNQYGYSFCTSNFNNKGKVDIEGVQKAIKQAGGLNYVISKSNNIDFKGADDYWPIAEALSKQKLEEEVAILKKKQAEDASANSRKAEVEEAAKYRARKTEIQNASTISEIDEVIRALEWQMKNGAYRQDPEGLLAKANQKREQLVLAEQKHLAEWKKSLKEGDETNCGLLIEKKSKLIKVQMKSSSEERWVKLDDIQPAGKDCPIAGASANAASTEATKEATSTAKQTQCEHIDPVSEEYAQRGIISEVGEECLRSRGQRSNSGDRLACKMGNGLLLVYYFQRGENCSFKLIENNSWTGASIAVREYRNLSELMSSHYR